MNSILLKNCFHIWCCSEEKPVKNMDILIKDNLICRIEKNIKDPVDRIIDCSHHVVLPGFVNTHHHFYQTLTRNLPAVQNAKLFDWLIYLYDVWKYVDEEAIFYSSLLAMGELLKTGCTLSSDHHYLYPKNINCDIMETQFKAAELLGMRFSPTRGSMSLSKKDGGLPPDSVVQTEEAILKDCERVINSFHDSGDFSMRKIMLAPCSPFSVTEELMKETVLLARKHRVRLHTHLAETADEDDFCLSQYGRRPLKLMEDCGFIGSDVSFAHGIFFNEKELALLADSGTHIAHCPTSNMRLGSGICKVSEMIKRGINVGLAVDGSASNDSSDMLGEVRNALLLQRIKYGPSAINADGVLKLATENGADLLGFKKCGKIKKGYAADIAIFNINSMAYAGSLSDPSAALVFSGYNHETDYTLVNGKIVVEKGRLTGFDEAKITEKANRISFNMLKKAEFATHTTIS